MEQELEGRDGFFLLEGRDVFAVIPMGLLVVKCWNSNITTGVNYSNLK
jgi:hypothetical protein